MDIENRLAVAKGKRAGGRIEWETEVSGCKLLCLEWINNKVLLYSTENYIQYPMINHNAKECKKCVYVYIYMYIAIAKSLQSCPTLCDPIDGSPPGFPIPGILQARTLEWVAISFSNA